MTYPVPAGCPICGAALAVVRLHCGQCDTALEGRFAPGPFSALSAEQLAFAETFLRCEGKFTRMEGETGLSYPTLRGRLHEIIRTLGFEPGTDDTAAVDAATRQQILEDLDAGRIAADEALRQLKGVPQ
jgi:hypothetical protein